MEGEVGDWNSPQISTHIIGKLPEKQRLSSHIPRYPSKTIIDSYFKLWLPEVEIPYEADNPTEDEVSRRFFCLRI